MKIYLIRHAETVHNVTRAWAGTTDSNLTNHGTLQIECLAHSFDSSMIRFQSIFASDLTRARLTAEGICRHQPSGEDSALLTPTLTADLRERDFGSLEGTRWRKNFPSTESNTNPPSDAAPSGHVEIESSASMKRRATSFLNCHVLPLLFDDTRTRDTIAIVSHGVLLRVLWACLVELFDSMSISIEPGIYARHEGPASQLVPSWSNTGYMSLSIHSHPLPPPLPPRSGSPSQISSNTSQEQSNTSTPVQSKTVSDALLHGWSMKILAVNNKDHLSGLRRAGGGIGSTSHDTRQKRIDHFFG
ncbi:hypothetical protein N7509_007203 [Penicillium cosmopolitanum]|uniref:Phosphoglycerate mutase family protein n=1 Tax=Penicillium cosmopolitanum TaxID=1131564 RepID=A0A9W9VYC2_9EURO|nr:uncharacterized protein N7509_007203 [Penicillium cosmopolitanum]KAJ5391713.1 hypothetical protein N7509_007203 [Penicillium cosmopolitanum]